MLPRTCSNISENNNMILNNSKQLCSCMITKIHSFKLRHIEIINTVHYASITHSPPSYHPLPTLLSALPTLLSALPTLLSPTPHPPIPTPLPSYHPPISHSLTLLSPSYLPLPTYPPLPTLLSPTPHPPISHSPPSYLPLPTYLPSPPPYPPPHPPTPISRLELVWIFSFPHSDSADGLFKNHIRMEMNLSFGKIGFNFCSQFAFSMQ